MVCLLLLVACHDAGVQFGGPQGLDASEETADAGGDAARFDAHSDVLPDTGLADAGALDSGGLPTCPEPVARKERPAMDCQTGPCFSQRPRGQGTCYDDVAQIACPRLEDVDCASADFCGQAPEYGTTRPALERCLRGQAEFVHDPATGFVWEGTLTTDVRHADVVCPTGFRLPSPHELNTLVDFSFNPFPFDNAVLSIGARTLWTGTVLSLSGWVVTQDFGIGMVAQSDPNGRYASLCVEDYPVSHTTAPRFESWEPVAGEVVVTDGVSGHVWVFEAQSGLRWQAALAHCEGLSHGGFDDWRLPNAKEALSLVEFGLWSPASSSSIDFGGGTLWTSSKSTTYPEDPVIVDINTAQSYHYVNPTAAALCVRASED